MAYTTQTIVNYNDDPPADDGSAIVANQIKFSKVKDELADPVKVLAEAINTELLTAFSQLFLGNTSDEAVNFNVGATTDDGTLFNCTAALTATLPPAADAGNGFAVVFLNNTTGTLTIDGNGAETINGNATIISTVGLEYIILVSNGAAWFGLTAGVGFQSSSITDLTDADVAAGDLFAYADISDSNNLKKDEIQGIIDLANLSSNDSLQNYLSGLTLSNDTDTDHDINITAGQSSDSTNAKSLILTAETTKQIDAVFAAGNDAGGLFSGTVAADTTYHIFIIEKDSDSSIDAGFDTSITAANIPAGFTKFRRVGSVVTDSSSNIINGTWLDDFFLLKTPILDVDTAALGTTAVTFALSSPGGLKLQVLLNVLIIDGTNDANVYISSLDSDDQAPVAAASPLATEHDDNTAAGGVGQIVVFTNTSSQIRARAGQTPDAFRLALLGWRDTRGK